MSIADRLYAQARITPIQPQNQIKEVRKLENGDLFVTQHSGNTFTVSQQDDLFQAFVIYTVLGRGF